MKIFAPLAATLILTCVSAIATAQDPAPSLTVQYADLDLNKSQGVDTLLKRIKGAAQKLCVQLDGRSVREKTAYSSCVDLATSSAVARVDRPTVTVARLH